MASTKFEPSLTDGFMLIDGSEGEGGGQILRSSMSLSVITGVPIKIVNIRAGRPKPGLAAQHLMSVRAAAQVSRGKLTGDEVGSTELTFQPGHLPISGGKFRFSIGTAGSGTLVLQTVLPILLMADGPSVVEVDKCGTHNPMSPPYDFLAECFVPTLKRLGMAVSLSISRYGFYPAGGGAIRAEITPLATTIPMLLLERGKLVDRELVAAVASIPQTVCERELAAARAALGWKGSESRDVRLKDSGGPGNYILAILKYENVCELATAIGERRMPSEEVAAGVVAEISKYLAADAPVGEHLADQLLLPLVLGSGGIFRTIVASSHLTTNIATINRFLGPLITCTPVVAGSGCSSGWEVAVTGLGHAAVTATPLSSGSIESSEGAGGAGV